MQTRTALIVGAGIGGLAAGIALRRAGWRIRIFERAATPREVGFALNLAANAMAALEELGVAGPILSAGHQTARAEIRAGDGRVLKRLDLRSAVGSARTVVATRAVLHGALLEAVGTESLVLDSTVARFHAAGGRVRLELANGHQESGDLLVGADGVGSVVRRQLHPDEPPPVASGYCAVRGVATAADHQMGDVSAATYLGTGIEASIARAGAGVVYWYISMLDTDVPGDPPPREAVERFLDRLDDTFRSIVTGTAASAMRFDRLFDRDPLDRWGEGVITLLGDAAHPMLPHTGQGAAQALEDAVALGLVLSRSVDVREALRRYERVRAARTRRLVTRGRRAARMTTTRSVVAAAIRTLLLRLVPADRMARMFMMAGEHDPHRELR